MTEKDRYGQAGVSLDAANEIVDRLKPLVRKTYTPGVMTDIGSFGGLFSLASQRYESPVLVSATDGVGTKLKVALMMGKHDTIGLDLVAMVLNDIIVLGAKPLFFLDYLAVEHLDVDQAEEIIKGIAEGCRQAQAALLGGETAEMPGLYRKGEYDLAGFGVGIVEKDRIIDGSTIRVGDALIGVGSSGVHSNGFSLIRKIFFEELGLVADSRLEGLDCSLGEEILKPTKIYAELVRGLLRERTISGMAHITGGGLTENIPRILPGGCRVEIDPGSWPVPPILGILEDKGRISTEEMRRTFNMGVGLVLAVPAKEAQETLDRVRGAGEKGWLIGEVRAAKEGLDPVVYLED